MRLKISVVIPAAARIKPRSAIKSGKCMYRKVNGKNNKGSVVSVASNALTACSSYILPDYQKTCLGYSILNRASNKWYCLNSAFNLLYSLNFKNTKPKKARNIKIPEGSFKLLLCNRSFWMLSWSFCRSAVKWMPDLLQILCIEETLWGAGSVSPVEANPPETNTKIRNVQILLLRYLLHGMKQKR